MRIVAIEEHVARAEMVDRIPAARIAAAGWPTPDRADPAAAELGRRLVETADARIAAMDQAGVTQQVLSIAGPGAELLAGAEAATFAADYNDFIAQMVQAHPDRLAGFAHLPMSDPEAAADELERAVSQLRFCGGLIKGTTDGRFLDDPRFDVLLARAARLDCPLYLHPAPPPPPVRQAYFDDLPHGTGPVLATSGWGWHVETGLHVVRLVLGGAFDRHPNLKIIVGHMGEAMPMMLARLDDVLGHATGRYLRRSVSQTILEQVWVTTSAFYTLPPFLAALTSFGVDRILFSIDDPYAPGRKQVEFLERLPVSPADKLKIAHGNADRLLKLGR